jgi:hypothetical protein
MRTVLSLRHVYNKQLDFSTAGPFQHCLDQVLTLSEAMLTGCTAHMGSPAEMFAQRE